MIINYLGSEVQRRQGRSAFGRYLADDIGDLRVIDVDAETVIDWQSDQLDVRAPLTVLNARKVACCSQAICHLGSIR